MKRQKSGSQKSLNQPSQPNQLERVVLGTVVYADELLKLGDRYPKAIVQEEMFDRSNIIRVDSDLLKDELQKDGKNLLIEVIPNTLAVFMGHSLAQMDPTEDTLLSFSSSTENLLRNLLRHPVKLSYRIFTPNK